MPAFSGTVIDAGGGEVRILVDRDTMVYPTTGSRVVVSISILEAP